MKRPSGRAVPGVCAGLVAALLGQPDWGRAQDGHPSACHPALAGAVSRAVLERPVALTDTAGRLHQPVSTTSAEAQAYYDQGITYLASYVWIEAARAFHEALRRDPELAMAQLGLAKAYTGAEAFADARRYVQRANDLAARGNVTAKEARWIAVGRQQVDALAAPEGERAAQHQAYKQALEELIALDPDDPHAWLLRGNAEEPGAWGRGQLGGVGAIAYYEAALHLVEEGAHRAEVGALTAEQELSQVGGRAQDVVVVAADVAHPGAAHQVADQPVELAQAVRDPRAQLDHRPAAAVRIQKVQVPVPHGLELPQRHDADDAGYLFDQRLQPAGSRWRRASESP